MRILLLALVLLNALFFGWTRGWLDEVVGLKARGDREPERMASQLHPERLRLLGPQAMAALQKRVCLSLGPLDGDAALQAALIALEKAGVPASARSVQSSELPGVWAVASIRLPNKDFQARKEETYKKMRIAFEYLQSPPEEMPTMLLSRHPSEKAAEAALEAFSQRALKGLRVLQLQAPGKQHNLVIAQADGALQARLAGSGYKACAAAPAAPASAASGAASAP